MLLGTGMGRPVPPRSAVRQRSKRKWSAQYIRLPFQSVLETGTRGNSVGTLPRSLLASRMLGASPTVPITNTLSPVKSNVRCASSSHSPELKSDRRNWDCQSK